MTLKDLCKPYKKQVNIAIVVGVISYSIQVAGFYLFTCVAQFVLQGEMKKAFTYILIDAITSFVFLFTDYLFKKKVNTVVKLGMLEYRKHMVELIKNSSKKIDTSYYISALNNDSKQVEAAFKLQFQMYEGVIMTVVSLIGLATLNWVLAIVAIGMFFFVTKSTKPIEKMAIENETKRSDLLNKYLKRSSDLINGFGVWNVYNRKKQFEESMDSSNVEFETINYGINNKTVAIENSSLGLSYAAQSMNHIIAFVLVYTGYCMPGLFFTSGMYSGNIHTGMYVYNQNKAKVAGIDELIQKRCVEIVKEDSEIVPINDFEIEVKDLDFKYDEKQILNHCNVSFKQGRKYMVIGASGSGKSTLLKLLSKELNPNDGIICLGDQNYDSLNATTIHNYIGYVHQDPYIFNDTLRSNITLNVDIDEDRLQQALEYSKVQEFISDLDQVIDLNGENLSGGQKQRIAIARELVSDHKIILFDEVNSSLDKELNVDLLETLVKLDQTIVFVTHNYDAYTSGLFDEVIDLSLIQEVIN